MDVADILDVLDDHGFEHISTTRKLEALNEAYWDACGREPWPFLQRYVRLAFTGTTDTASNWPSDFQAVFSMEYEGGTSVAFMRIDDWEQAFGSITAYTGIPNNFYLLEGEAHFWPWPSSDMRVRMTYIMTPDELDASSVTADIVLPKQYHRSLLVNGALYRLYAMQDDMEQANGFQQFFEQSLEKMRTFAWRQQYQRPDTVRVTDPDDLGWD